MFCFCSCPAAVAEIRDSLGAHRVSILPGLGDGSGRHGLVPHAGHQPLRTERLYTEMGSSLLLTSWPWASRNLLYHSDSPPARALTQRSTSTDRSSGSDVSTELKTTAQKHDEDESKGWNMVETTEGQRDAWKTWVKLKSLKLSAP